MKAAVLYGFGQPLVVEDIEIDAPKEGEIKVKLAACAICHSDIHAIEGAWGGSLPVVYGHEAAGVVDEVGAGVVRVAPGDQVVVTLIRSCGRCYHCARGDLHICESTFALDAESRLRTRDGDTVRHGIKTGAFAEYVIVDQSQAIPVPEEVPLDSASLLACGVITGLGAVVNTAGVEAGSSVVVIGSGGVGLNSIQGAMLCGAHPIIAADLLDTKLEAARKFGASHTINLSQTDAPENLVREYTSGRGADYVFITVGSGEAVEQGMTMTRRGGAVVVVGMPPSGVKAAFEVESLAYDSRRILGSNMGSARPGVDIPYLVRLYLSGRLKLDELITARYPLQGINEAISAVKQGKALRNVIVFQ
jgi:Zn-dependent alcohol dehydrogenase